MHFVVVDKACNRSDIQSVSHSYGATIARMSLCYNLAEIENSKILFLYNTVFIYFSGKIVIIFGIIECFSNKIRTLSLYSLNL